MKEPAGEFSASAVQAKRAQYAHMTKRDDPAFAPRENPIQNSNSTLDPSLNTKRPAKVPFDPWRILAALKASSRWIGCAAAMAGLLSFGVGFLSSNYTVRVTLLARESTGALALSGDSEAYRPRQFTTQTLVNLMQSAELLRRVAAASKPPLKESALEGRINVSPIPQTISSGSPLRARAANHW